MFGIQIIINKMTLNWTTWLGFNHITDGTKLNTSRFNLSWQKNSPKVYILFNDYVGDENYPKRCNNESLPLSTASPSTTKSGSDQSHTPDNLLNYAMEKLITLTGHVFELLVQNTKRLVLTMTIEPQTAEEPKINSTSTPTPMALPQSSGTITNHSPQD